MANPAYPPDYSDLIRAGQRSFRRLLVRDFTDTARVLESEYETLLARLNPAINRLIAEAVANRDRQALRDSEQLRNLRDETEAALSDLQRVLAREAAKMQRSGVAAAPGYANDAATAVNITARFNMPRPEALEELIDIVGSPAFQARLGNYSRYHADYITSLLNTDFSLGKGPVYTARHIARYLRSFPLADAKRMTRTVQLYAARRGVHRIYEQNADVVVGWYWGSSLDRRTCPSCLSQHGQRFGLRQTLNDHHQGRCAPVPISEFQRDVRIETGEEWLRRQPDTVQREQLGPARWRAWRDGAISFSQMSAIREDEVYGPMRYAPSLRELLGADAAQYYA